MADTYADKRAELEAIATGGTAGREAYRTGQQRIVSDQRAAIDRALGAVPSMNREAGTNDFLESIIRPVGDAGAARMDFAGDRFGSSMGALDSALGSALATQGVARDANYSTRLSDSRLATDRTLNLAREQDALAERRRKAREAEEDQYTTGELKAIAELLGGEMQGETRQAEVDYQAPEFKRELSRISGRAFAHIRDPKERQALLGQVLNAGSAGDMDAVMALVDQYAPEARDEFDGLLTGGMLNFVDRAAGTNPILGGITEVADQVMGRPVQDRTRGTDIDAILNDLASLQLEQERRLRTIDADRYLFNQDAYARLTGDPLLAAAVFPQDFSPAKSAMDDALDRETFIDTGMDQSQYEAWLEDQESYEVGQQKFDIATGAATNPALVDRIGNAFLGSELLPDLYAALEPGNAGHEVVTNTISAAMETATTDDGALDFAGIDAGEIITEAEIAARADAEAAGFDRGYADALAAIVREQLEVYFSKGR